MSVQRAIGLIDNLQHIDQLVLQESYGASLSRYMAAVGGNTGNLAFVQGTKKCIDDKIVRINWGWKTEQVHANVDLLVISCANQIGKHVDLGGWAEAVVRMDLPVVLVGLGAQTPNYEEQVDIPEGSLRFLQEVQKRRPGSGSNISVRGEFTKSVLAEHGFDSIATGCPSLYISGEQALGRMIAARCRARPIERIAVAAGNPFHPGNRKVEQRMVELCNGRGDTAYVVQHPDILVELALGRVPEDSRKLQVITDALGFADATECCDWFHRNGYVFHDCGTWMHLLRHYDAVVGARYHGVALGVQAGVPGLTLHIDNRTRELCATTGIPSIGIQDLAPMSLDDIVDAMNWSEATGHAFDENRANRARLTLDFIAANGISPSEQLQQLAR